MGGIVYWIYRNRRRRRRELVKSSSTDVENDDHIPSATTLEIDNPPSNFTARPTNASAESKYLFLFYDIIIFIASNYYSEWS